MYWYCLVLFSAVLYTVKSKNEMKIAALYCWSQILTFLTHNTSMT